MLGSDIPTLRVLIKPQFDLVENVKSLSIFLTLKSPQVQAGNPLVLFPITVKNVLCGSHVESLKAVDGEGSLPAVLESDGNQWTTGRSTSGTTQLAYDVS